MNFDEEIEKYSEEMIGDYTKELCDLIRIRSVSAEKEKKEEMYRVLKEIIKIITPIGFTSEIIETKRNPALIATLKVDDDKPWLMVYNHMDVQPANEPEWKTPAFEPEVKNGRITGRGSTDDKGPALTVIKAIKFLKERGYQMPNVQLLYETEEEIGSPNFGQLLEENLKNGKIKRPSSILISDTEFEGEHPSISYKLRGVITAYASLEVAEREAHSGTIGGIAVNPLKVLITALSTCYKENDILIPGWHEEIIKPDETEEEYSRIAAEKFDKEKFLNDLGIREITEEEPRKIIRRVWHEPTFEVHGFEGVQHIPGITKNSVPRSATAKISLRIVPGQRVEKLIKLLEEQLKKTHSGIRVEGEGMPAFLTKLSSPFIKKASEACIYGYKKEPLYVGAGGTIGAASEMQRIMGEVPVVMISQSLLSDGYHAPNEEFRIEQALKGCKVMAKYINSIAEMK